MQVGAVQPAVHVRQGVIGIPDLEVAPEPVRIIFFRLDEELAGGRRVFHDGAVIAEGGEVVVRVDSSEQRLGRLVHEVGKDLVQRTFARIGARRQRPAVCELAVRIEGQAALDAHVVAVPGFVRREEFGRPVRLVSGQGQVGDPHGEPVALFQLQVAQKDLAVSGFVKHRHLDGMHALRQDLFRHETALLVHGHRIARHPHPLSFGDRAAVGLHRAAVKVDILAGDAALAVTGQQLFVDLRFGNRRIDACRPSTAAAVLVSSKCPFAS